MRKLHSNLASSLRHMAVGLAAVSGTHFDNVQASPLSVVPTDVGEQYTVCHNVSVPPNHALVGIQTNHACADHIAYIVAPAKPGLRICNLSETVGGAPGPMPFPLGYIVQAIEHVEYLRSQCGGVTAVYVIQLVSEGITACSGSHLPAGWSFTSSSPSSGSCGTLERNELHKAIDNLRVCTQSPYPEDFVVGAIEPTAACGIQERYVLRTATEGTKACGPSHIPTGYVVTNVDRSGQCSEYQTLTLRTPHDGIVVCPTSPIPNRYVIETTIPYGGCENFATANRLKYIP
jgi:hypothetical protein